MKPKPAGPAKSVVHRTPEQELSRIDARIDEISPRSRQLRLFATLSLVFGLVATAAVTAAFWFLKGWIVIWGGPELLVGGALGVYFMRAAGSLENEHRALNMERRRLARETETTQPYGHKRNV